VSFETSTAVQVNPNVSTKSSVLTELPVRYTAEGITACFIWSIFSPSFLSSVFETSETNKSYPNEKAMRLKARLTIVEGGGRN
jgi:hypothetical protein